MKSKAKTLNNTLLKMIKATEKDLEYPAYGNYCPSKKTFILALKIAILDGKIKI